MKLKITENKKFLQVIESTDDELNQLKLSLRRRITNAHFHPLVKAGHWDGYIEFIDKYCRIPFGLWNVVQELCDSYDFNLEFIGLKEFLDYENFNKDDYLDWEKEYYSDMKIKPRDYQTSSVLQILKWKRSISEIATSAGKTLIIFNIFAYLKHKNKLDYYKEFVIVKNDKTKEKEKVEISIKEKMLVIVPNIQLVLQTMEKFEQYSKDKKKIKYKIQPISGGEDKNRKDVDIIIGTYQSLRELPDVFFKGVKVVCVDESHHTKIQSIQTVFKKCKEADFRFGLSGTARLSIADADSYTMQGLLGPLVNKISPKFLSNRGFITPVNIRVLYLNYLEIKLKRDLYELKKRRPQEGAKILQLERELIITNSKRLEYITDLISNTKKNGLVLFHDIKNKYGRTIYENLLEKMNNNVQLFYVDGSTEKRNREHYRKMMDKKDDIQRIMVASFGTFSQGIDINNLHYLFLTESYKSEIIIMQSLGRGMRLSEDKPVVNIVDFVDDFSYNGNLNYVYKHALERISIYEEEKFNYKEIKIKI